MARQISTSVSDFVLVLSVGYVTLDWVRRGATFAAVGLAIQGLAATAGTVRFAMNRPEQTSVVKLHKFLSMFTSLAGLALISFECCLRYSADAIGYVILVFSVIVLVATFFLLTKNKEVSVQASSGLSILTILVLCIMNTNWFGTAAAAVYVLAGLIVGADGDLVGIPRIDILHYALVVGNLLFMKAF